MADVLRHWLARGVDGVRVDAVPHLVEDELLRDDVPGDLAVEGMPNQGGLRHFFTSDRPENLDCVAEMRAVVEEFDARVLIGEAHLPTALLMRYHGGSGDGVRPGLHMPFNFALLETLWEARALAAAIDHDLTLLPPEGCPNWVLGNHDEVRVASRIGAGAARGAALLAFTLGGTPVIYNGEELGLEDVPYAAGDLRRVPEMRHPDHALQSMPHRAPIPWDGGPHAGFTGGAPWLPLGADDAARNVVAQAADPRSMLTLYRRLIALRRATPALLSGSYHPLRPQGSVLLFGRRAGASRFEVAVNVGGTDALVRPSDPGFVVLSTYLDRDGGAPFGDATLRPHEGLIVRLG